MTTTTPPPAFRPGARRALAGDVHSVPLGYDRAAIGPGTPLPLPASEVLVERMRDCTRVELAFHDKLGDSLLALATARAALDRLGERRHVVPPTVHASGPHTELIDRTGLLTPATSPAGSEGPRLVIGDRAGITARGSDATLALVCDPAAPPCWSSDGVVHTALPDRHYLALERRLGIRLPSEPPFTPRLTARPNRLVHRLRAMGWLDGVALAAITATSRADLKDYTAPRFTAVARRVAEILDASVRLLLIGGEPASGIRITAADARDRVQSLRLDGLPADDVADLLPHCSLVIGNDTGLTHLAALSRTRDGTGPQVIGLHARHSAGKWNTGLPHHHAVATGFAELMHQGDLCPVRDAVVPPTEDAHLAAITPDRLAHIAVRLLTGGRP
ncbi:glycosyltransferase family 9 protein [Streptomyces sp. ST2-7A]|uniref:glycosyltransferase family 9 protein n=1 Tax=Streptomyces sp. ST2-7A TaxID=2907214 RepID=UPI001F328CE3|nr:glycosyltransferase family 9 protein [Streptomyces sp. ST2-7A]MCE7082815.1 lipopolysaccharide heptosyltransferase family protein [Streptomyces sp. ST2-7A]